MKYLAITLMLLGAGAVTAAAAYDEEGLSEAIISSDTAKAEAGDEEDEQTLIQENDEDLSAFVLDYIGRDIQLKGSFLFDDIKAGKVLKLSLVSVGKKAREAAGGAKTITAVFQEKPGKKYTLVFHLHSGSWGGLDIFKIEMLNAAGAGEKAKK